LAFETNLHPGVHARRDGDHHLLPRTDLSGTVARRAALARDRSLPEAHRTRALHGESALSERDRASPGAFRAGLNLRARRGAGAVRGRASRVHPELDRHLAARRCDAKWNAELGFDVLATLRPAGASRRARARSEHRAEEISNPPQPDVVEVLETERAA